MWPLGKVQKYCDSNWSTSLCFPLPAGPTAASLKVSLVQWSAAGCIFSNLCSRLCSYGLIIYVCKALRRFASVGLLSILLFSARVLETGCNHRFIACLGWQEGLVRLRLSRLWESPETVPRYVWYTELSCPGRRRIPTVISALNMYASP